MGYARRMDSDDLMTTELLERLAELEEMRARLEAAIAKVRAAIEARG